MQRRVNTDSRPWHPFRRPGMCGIRGTTCVLVTIAVIIVSITLLREVEKVRQNVTTPHKRELAASRSPPNTNPLRITLEPGKDESFLCDLISTIMGVDDNWEEMRQMWSRFLFLLRSV